MSDLPGFYRDPKTGKYFRDNPAVLRNKSLVKRKKENETERKISEESSINISKYSDIFKFLRAREIGPSSGVNSERDFCKMTVSNKKLVNKYNLNSYRIGNVRNVNYIKGTPSFILGVWTTDEDNIVNNIVTSESLHMSYDKCRYHSVYAHYVTDVCEGPDKTVIYVFNNPEMGSNKLVCFKLQSALSGLIYFRSKELPKLPLYCCSSTADGKHFAVGSYGMVTYYNNILEDGYRYPTMNKASVHTISFNSSSNLMVTGLNTGHVALSDIRLPKNVTHFKISEYCINDSHYLENDQVIFAGLDHVLCKVDLRMMNSVVAEYFRHRTSPKKSALSVANDMLCASGVDNVIRIWHLSGGDPIHEINPKISPYNYIKGWLFNQANKTYLYHFEGALRKTYLIA